MKRYEGPDSSERAEGNVVVSDDADTLPSPFPFPAAPTALQPHLRARWAAGHAQATAAWYRQRADRLAARIETDARILQQQAQLEGALAQLGRELRERTREGMTPQEASIIAACGDTSPASTRACKSGRSMRRRRRA